MSDSHLESSLTDMMTSLMVIFILLLVVFLNQQYLEREEKKEAVTNTVSDMKADLEDALIDAFKGISVQQDPEDPLTLVVIVPEGLLRFGVGQYSITLQSHEFLERFAPKFIQILCGGKFDGKIESLLVEGHTDSTADDNYNLELSQKRSLEVMLNMVGNAGVNNNCFLDIASASGRGERELVFGPEGLEDAYRSRRVQFKVRVKSILNEELMSEMGRVL